MLYNGGRGDTERLGLIVNPEKHAAGLQQDRNQIEGDVMRKRSKYSKARVNET